MCGEVKTISKNIIIANREIAPDHFLIELNGEFLAKNTVPGQFVTVKVEDNTTDPLLRLPLGVHSIGKKRVKLLYKCIGEGTKKLSRKRKGEILNILGPLGNGFDTAAISSANKDKAILVAGGHGIAPLYALSEALVRKNIEIQAFLGARTKDHIVCGKALSGKGVKLYIATEDGSLGEKGYATNILQRFLGKIEKRHKGKYHIYACGPKPMLKAVADIALKEKIAAQTSVDEYMACGIGACLGCAIKTVSGYKMVCKDGPVFDAKDVIW